MEKYKAIFLEAESYTIKKSFDPNMRDTIVAVLRKFFPIGNPVDTAFVTYKAVQLFQRYTSTLETMEDNIHCYMIGCLSIVLRYRSKDLDMSYIWQKEHNISLTMLKEMEDKIWGTLDGKIHQLTPFYFMEVFQKYLPFTRHVPNIANKLILETQLNNLFIHRGPPLIALSALMISTDTKIAFVMPYLESTCIKVDELEECVKDMDGVYRKWDCAFKEDETDPFAFTIDWLRNPVKLPLLDLSSLCGKNKPICTFKDSSGFLIEVDPISKMEVSHPIFEDVYIRAYDEKQKTYVVRLLRQSVSEENLNKRKGLTHPNIVMCQDLVLTDPDHPDHIFVLFEYSDHHLSHQMEWVHTVLSESIKSWMHQILNGINYYHSNLGAHGHIRPESILLKNNNDSVLIADFCFNKNSSKLKRSRHDTSVTYRAPENILNSSYIEDKKPGDIWAIGCLFGYFVTGEHLFKGTDDMSRLKPIFSRLGTPSEENWPKGVLWHSVEFEQYGKIDPPEVKVAFCPKGNIKEAGKDEIELLSAMLCLDPEKRVTAEGALELAYFKDFQTKS